MLAKDIMTKGPELLSPDATLKDAALQMKSHDFGFIPIGENDRLVGAITDRDIVIRAVAEGQDTGSTLRDIMSEGIFYCYEMDDLETVVNKMEELQVRRLVVLNKDKRITGIISLGDIARKCRDKELCAELTEAVSER